MTDTPDSFFQQIYALVRSVPAGKVTTYGAIANALHTKDARRIGHALHANPDSDLTPCHRVVFSDGRLAPGYAFGGPKEQLRKLELEGVVFLTDTQVDLSKSLYTFPAL
ncbi:MGMT family protein [Candidatus Gottesmanbacteria bacterium]|nr:MGMT family protein [Candidatus Gottesmanbacteria bacterium]